MNAVSFLQILKALWLHKGEQVAFGDDVQGICDRYERFLEGKEKL